jgi:hypothetical protein
LKIPRPHPFLQSQPSRAQKQTFLFIKEVSAKFSSPEDVILAKLERFRLGGFVRQVPPLPVSPAVGRQ